MKQFFALLILIVLCALTAIGQDRADPQCVWAESAGGTAADAGQRIAVDHAGNSYITGYFCGTADFGSTQLTSAGEADVFIAGMDAEGNFLWATGAGGTNYDYGYGIAVDTEGNIFVTGYFAFTSYFGSTELISAGAYDVFVAKLDAGGNFLWAKRAGGVGTVQAYDLALDADDNIYITGIFMGTANFDSLQVTSSGPIDVFTAKMDADGNFLWVRCAGGTSPKYSYHITVDNAGNSYITGFFYDTSIFGSTELVSAGDKDVFIAKIDTEGNYLWAKRAGGTEGDLGYGIAVDNAGSLFVTGFFQQTADFGSTQLICAGTGYEDVFITRMDTEGNFLWAKRAGGTKGDYGYAIFPGEAGSSYITGCFKQTADFGDILLESMGDNDIYVARLDADGNFLWVIRAGGTGSDLGYDIAAGDTDNPHITGYFQGTAGFGDKQIISAGATDIFAARIACLDSAVISIKSSGAGGIYIWEYDEGMRDKGSDWTKIGSQLNAKKILTGDVTGDGIDDVVVHFSDSGLYFWDGNTWTNIAGAGDNVADFAVVNTGHADHKEIVASVSDTLSVYRDGSWKPLLFNTAGCIASLNFDRDINGIEEVAFASDIYPGLYIYNFRTASSSVICHASPSQIIAGDADGDGYPEIGAVFDGLGTYLIRYLPDKTEKAGQYEPFDLLRDIKENSKWVSKGENGRGLQFARLVWVTPDAGHHIAMGDITEGTGSELFMVYGGRTYYYCSDTAVWATFLYAPLKRIISGLFTPDVKDGLIVCDSSTGDIWFRNADTSGWELLVPAFDTDAMGVLK